MLFLKTRHKGPEYTYGHSYVHRLGNQADIDTYTSPRYLYNQRFRHSYFWTNYTHPYLKQKESWQAIYNSNRFSINMAHSFEQVIFERFFQESKKAHRWNEKRFKQLTITCSSITLTAIFTQAQPKSLGRRLETCGVVMALDSITRAVSLMKGNTIY